MILQRNPNRFKMSLALPTRKRPEALNETLHSIFSLANPGNVNFEVIMKVDFDDTETIDYMKHWSNEFENITFIVNSRRGGWLNLVDYFEDIINTSKGEWVIGINDDMLFKTQNWNDILEEKLQGYNVYFLNTNGYRQSFWAVPKNLKDVLGHIAPHNQIDTYLHMLSMETGMEKYIDEVFLEHDLDVRDEVWEDKAQVVDTNFATREYHRNSPEFKSDIIKLKQYLNTLN